MQVKNKTKINENGSPGPETPGDHWQRKRGGNPQCDADLFEAECPAPRDGSPHRPAHPSPTDPVSSQYLAFWWQLPYRDLNWSKWKALDEWNRSQLLVWSLRIQKALKCGQVRLMEKRTQGTLTYFCSFRDWSFGPWCLLKPYLWHLEFRMY